MSVPEGAKANAGRQEIGIVTVRSAIPESSVDAVVRAQAIGVSRSEIESRIGFTRLSRRYPGQDASDLCLAAARRLIGDATLEAAALDCLVVVTQNPDGYGIPHTAALVQRKLGVPETCASIDLSLGGSGYVYGLSLMKGFMETNGLSCGLLFTADPNSRMLDELDPRTALQFGDAATATLLSVRPNWTIGRSDYGTAGVSGPAMEVRMDQGGRLRVDENAVQEFALSRVPHSVARVLELNGLRMADIDRVLVHQTGRALVEALGEKLGAVEKTGFHAAGYGDTGSSSIPILLEQCIEPSDRRVLISGFGTGLSWGTMVLTRVE